ncbi:hypothetical protein JTB14_018506 [Gonioctena quinquepunctata]|nr:hypothetical protein JTB14_018506 [Gonioctena quinquepunctata]
MISANEYDTNSQILDIPQQNLVSASTSDVSSEGDSDSTDSDSDQRNQQPADILDALNSDDTLGDTDYSDRSGGEASKKDNDGIDHQLRKRKVVNKCRQSGKNVRKRKKK